MTTDRSPSMMEYLMSLTPEEAADIVKKLPAVERAAIIRGVCGVVNDMAKAVVLNADEIWENQDGQ